MNINGFLPLYLCKLYNPILPYFVVLRVAPIVVYKKIAKPLAFFKLLCYNNSVIDNSVINEKEAENLAHKNHSLDDGIIRSAYEEFLACGFQKASLHKIAEKAGVTTGAIYTRYKNKDALFVCLLQDFMNVLEEAFAPVVSEYEKAERLATSDALLEAINSEEKIYIRLLREYYNECTLFFSRSGGSSVEAMLNGLIDRKTEQTAAFFAKVYGKMPNADAVRLLMGAQFWYFRKLLDERQEEEKMIECLDTLLCFFNAGWRQLCNSLE